MGLIAAGLATLSARAESLGYVDADFVRTLQLVERLAGGLDAYTQRCTTPESPALARLAEQTRREHWAGRYEARQTAVELEQEMLSGHLEGQFLKMLVHATKARRVLEIGLFTGYSALAMAEALPADGTLLALEIDAYAAAFAARQFDGSAHRHKIHIEVGPALESLQAMAGGTAPFDLIFIDADKANYLGYLDAVVEGGLLSAGGLVCVDNTLMQGQPYAVEAASAASMANGRAIAAFNEALMHDSRFEQVLIPVRDGITLIRRT